MDLSQDMVRLIFMLVLMAFGVHGWITGKITYSYREDDEDNRTMTGTKAKFISAVTFLSGVSMLFSFTLGLSLMVLIAFLTWLLDR
jgi:succinate dehydrogenase hydrophobic anchor subunit